MKVLHVEAGRHYYGGARQVAYIVEGLAARGVDNLLTCPPGAAIAQAVGRRVGVVEMPMGGDADVGFIWRLKRLITAARPDLVHIHSRRGADLWGGVAARLAGVPCVLSRRVDNPEARAWVALKYRLFDRVITISEAIRAVLAEEGVPPHKLVCVRSALDATPWLAPVDRLAMRRAFGLPDDALVVGMVAQLIARKGHRHLFATLPALLERFPHLKVLVWGRGPLEDALRTEAAQPAYRGAIHFGGFRDDLPCWMGGLDVLAHPAEMEGLGIALLQAAAAGVPIVTSRAGGLPEAVADGVSGILTAPGDVPALTDALSRLLADAGLRTRMGAAGRARILAEFSIDAMVEGNLAVYRQLLESTAS